MRWTGCGHAAVRLLWLVCGVLASASSAHAADVDAIRARLRVEPGATCLTAEQLAVEVEPLLEAGRVPSDLVFVVEGSAIDPRSARLRVVRQDRTIAQRAFEPGPDRCGHLHAAVGLAIALAINAAYEQAPERAREWSVSAAFLGAYRVLPRLAPGLELLARRELGEHVRVRAGVLGLGAFGVAVAPGAGTFDAVLLAARAEGCAHTELGSAMLGAGACLGLLAGALHAWGGEVARATRAVVPWLALSGAVDLELALSPRWSLELGLRANVLLHRVAVGVEDARGARVESRALDQVGFALAVGPVYYF